ncbi:recombinase family protein [Ferrimonas sp. YFM]|uniref:recombinase family protein n=1 Tax=Ferrimonas sp. YFM TaxID=3028878 RepID=UPI0025742750|nr:recombinase family protein [Ferrimonas sp. YFM]BDY05383.1 site-specific recombinase [Ferrimonas sp. YFM]
MSRQKAISYQRFSKQEQIHGDSLRRQSTAAQSYAAEHDLELIDVYLDKGRSGYHGHHVEYGELGALVKMVEAGEIEQGTVLLVESLDRLSRQKVTTALQQFLSLLNAGIEIATLMDGKRYTADSVNDLPDLMMSLLVMARAHEESAAKSVRSKANWERQRQEAKESGKPVKWTPPAWLKRTEDSYEVIEDRASVVKEIFKLCIEGHGYYSIATDLNQRGIKPFGRAQGWAVASVRKIITSRAPIGELQPRRVIGGKGAAKPDGDPIPNLFPRIVSDADWHEAQKAVGKRKLGGGGKSGNNFANLFQGVFHCSCGATMQVNKKPSGRPYCVCYNAKTGQGCKHLTHPYHLIEQAVVIALTKAQPVQTKGNDDRVSVIKEAVRQLEAEQVENQSKIENALNFILSGNSSPAVQKKMEELEARSLEIEVELKQSRNDLSDAMREPESQKGVLEQLADATQSVLAGDDVNIRRKYNAWLRALDLNMVIDTEAGVVDVAPFGLRLELSSTGKAKGKKYAADVFLGEEKQFTSRYPFNTKASLQQADDDPDSSWDNLPSHTAP